MIDRYMQTDDLKMPRALPPCSRKITRMPHARVYRVILDPKGGDAGSVSPGVEKSLRVVQ